MVSRKSLVTCIACSRCPQKSPGKSFVRNRPDFLEIHLPFEILCTLLIYFLNELNVGYYTGVEIPSLLFSKRRGGSQITPTFLATPQNANASRNNFVMNLDLEGLWGFVKKFKHNSS